MFLKGLDLGLLLDVFLRDAVDIVELFWVVGSVGLEELKWE